MPGTSLFIRQITVYMWRVWPSPPVDNAGYGAVVVIAKRLIRRYVKILPDGMHQPDNAAPVTTLPSADSNYVRLKNFLASELKRYISPIRPNFLVEDGLGFILIAYISCITLYWLDLSYDSLAYHIPFASIRTGIVKHDEFVLREDLRPFFNGFPIVVDLVQGWLWKIFGRPEATSLISTISILILGTYLRVAYRIGLIWTLLIFLAVPVTATAINASYTDLWTNAFFALHLIAGVKSARSHKYYLAHSIVSCAALAISVNSKEQYFVIGGLSYAMFLLERTIPLIRIGASEWIRSREGRGLLIFLLAAPLIFFVPIKNLIVFGNPIYPISVTVAGHKFPGPELDNYRSSYGPRELIHLPEPAVYFLSQLDLNGVDMRPGGYMLGQGDLTGNRGPGDRMGGSLGVLLLASTVYLIFCLSRLNNFRAHGARSIGFIVIVGLISTLPGANELRYFSFTELSILLSTLILLNKGTLMGDKLSEHFNMAFRVLLVSAAIFTASLNEFSHFRWPHQKELKNVLTNFDVPNTLLPLLKQSNTICYARPDQTAILFSPAYTSKALHVHYRFVSTWGPEACPRGSAILK